MEISLGTILLNLFITVLAYGAFPIILSQSAKESMEVKQYKRFCWLFNILVMFVFMAINESSTINAAPYVLWTSIFVAIGKKALFSYKKEKQQGTEKEDKELDKVESKDKNKY